MHVNPSAKLPTSANELQELYDYLDKEVGGQWAKGTRQLEEQLKQRTKERLLEREADRVEFVTYKGKVAQALQKAKDFEAAEAVGMAVMNELPIEVLNGDRAPTPAERSLIDGPAVELSAGGETAVDTQGSSDHGNPATASQPFEAGGQTEGGNDSGAADAPGGSGEGGGEGAGDAAGAADDEGSDEDGGKHKVAQQGKRSRKR